MRYGGETLVPRSPLPKTQRSAFVLSCLIGLVSSACPVLGQQTRKTIILEFLLPEESRLFIDGEEATVTGAVRKLESAPLPPGKYAYTIKAIVPGPAGPQTIIRTIEVQPGDFESIDFRPRRPGQRVPDVIYEPTPQEAVEALLNLAQLKPGDVLWDLGCGDGRIPVTAARKFGIQGRGIEIDPKCLKQAHTNVQEHGVDKLVTIEDRDIFTLDLSRGPTVVTLYLLPSLNARLLPQLQKLPAGSRVLSVGHRMGDIPADQQVTVDTEDGEYTLYLWRVETLQKAAGADAAAGTEATTPSALPSAAAGPNCRGTTAPSRRGLFRRR